MTDSRNPRQKKSMNIENINYGIAFNLIWNLKPQIHIWNTNPISETRYLIAINQQLSEILYCMFLCEDPAKNSKTDQTIGKSISGGKKNEKEDI